MSRSESWDHIDLSRSYARAVRRAASPQWRDIVAIAIFSAIGLAASAMAAIHFGVSLADIFTS